VFLTIDHVNGDGAELRRTLKGAETGVRLLRRLRDLGYPPEYTILCFNCNLAKSIRGECPHAITPAQEHAPGATDDEPDALAA